MADIIDLHIHSDCSDGIYPPRQTVVLAAAAGVSAMALADHDTLNGIDKAMEEGALRGVTVIPAVELSVAYRDLDDIHLLGFHLDHHDPQLKEKLAYYRDERARRCVRMIERINRRLSARGRNPLLLDEVEVPEGGAVGRPHIARALMARGYARTMQDAFEQYLIPCNVPKQRFPLAEAIEEIHRTSGVAVLAHPHSITTDQRELAVLVAEMVSLGLDGLEVYNNLCDTDDIAFLTSLTQRHDLVITGGSDFHGGNDGIEIGKVRGSYTVPDTLLVPLAARSKRSA